MKKDKSKDEELKAPTTQDKSSSLSDKSLEGIAGGDILAEGDCPFPPHTRKAQIADDEGSR